MPAKSDFKWVHLSEPGSFLFGLFLFCLVVLLKIPYSFSQYFYSYSLGLFLIVLVLYFLAFRLPERYRSLACFGLTMLLFALTLSYKWTSGYSDNKVIAGFLPYKDGAGYYHGASLILNGLSLENTLQAGWRPLFPGFLASVLFFTGGNLKFVLALLTVLAGIGAWLASRQVHASLGPLPAALFMTLLYFYIQPVIGLTMTELLGFGMGCFAFAILWMTALNPGWKGLVIGLVTLVLALSIRAGTFFILPLIAVWAGRIFRGERNFSWRAFGLSLLTILLVYFSANSLFARWVGVPEGRVFGNFAYSLYGQVQGGTGWHRAIEELGTRDPDIIYRAAFQFFLQHPMSLFIGTAKAYRDFILPRDESIFAFDVINRDIWLNYLIWGVVILLLIRGLIQLVRNISMNLPLLLIAGFTGIVLSIPFLPPIDGGSRFYASTVPFFMIVPVVGLSGLGTVPNDGTSSRPVESDRPILYTGAIVLFLLTLVMPLLILQGSPVASPAAQSCSSGEQPFVIRTYPGSYVDLIASDNRCGLAPEICLSDFDKNGIEKSVDDFYQTLYSLAQESRTDVRILPAINFLDGKLRYFVIPQDILQTGLLAGCAAENETKNQIIYQVKSISSIKE